MHGRFGLVILLAGSIVGFQPGPVAATDAKVTLPVPKGYCTLSDKHAGDRVLLELNQRINSGRNRVLRMFAKCGALKKYRATGGGIHQRGGYMAPQSAAGRRVSMPRRAFVTKVAEASRRIDMSRIEESIRDRAAKAGAPVQVQTIQPIGVIHTDRYAVYYGVVQGVTDGAGATTNIATVTALTVVRGRVISINLSSPYSDAGSLRKLLKDQRRNVRRLIRKNPESAG